MNKQELMEKYGLSEEQATNVEKAYKESLADFVPISRLNQEIEKTKAERERASELEKSMKDLEDYKGSTEGLQNKIADLNKQVEEDRKEYQKKVDLIAKRSAVVLALMNKEVRPLDKAMNTLVGAYDLDAIKIDKEGNIVSGFDEQDAIISQDMSFCYPTVDKKKTIVVEGGEDPEDGESSPSPKRAEFIMKKLLEQN